MNSSGHHLTSSMSNPRAAPASHTQFDALSNYMDAAFPPRSPQPSTVNSLLNLENMPPWARAGLRSDPPNCTDIGGGGVVLLGSSSSALTSAPAPGRGAGNYHHSSAQLPPPPPQPMSSSSCGDQAATVTAGRSSKKRSRASRRAPTTVLTTDTSNFRAMVQEFTGIPAPPFSASSFPRTRLDLFSSAASSAFRSAGLADAAQPPPYLLRPFAHKLQPSSSSPAAAAAAMLDVLSNSNTTSTTLVTTTAANGNAAAAATTSTTTTNSPTSNFQNQNLLNMNNNNNNNPIFTFQSLLQSPKYPPPLSNLPVFNNSKQPGSSSLKMAMMEDFAGNVASGSHLSALMAASADGGGLATTRTEHNWVDSGAGHGDADRNFGGNYDASNNQRVSHCKLNYAGSSSTEFQLHAEKGTENVITSRGEGMVDSWICSSD
ncbi:hypothetical protein H6P81_011540 [Aristolochia fimbriata]|uniref:VQ domain-containing protein n=1 Tax=Aristolochia fimbriata TaxID=158543 RepID=A0AAV7ERS8_ARIFI|nr:hypothetical protein H6P81_011540 [Aristolochia fimbriata]